MANKFKKDDIVQVLVGRDKGKSGKVLHVDTSASKIIIEGINVSKLHKKKNDKNQGGIIEMPRPIHISNVKLMCPEKKKAVKVGFKVIDGKKKRFSKSTGSTF